MESTEYMESMESEVMESMESTDYMDYMECIEFHGIHGTHRNSTAFHDMESMEYSMDSKSRRASGLIVGGAVSVKL